MNVRKSLKHTAGMAFFAMGLEELVHQRADRVDEDFPRVSTRGHFDVRPTSELQDSRPSLIFPLTLVDTASEVRLNPGHSHTDYETEGDFPDADEVDELTVFVHGWLANREASLGRMSMMEGALRKGGGYDGTVVGFTWDTDGHGPTWRKGIEIGRRNGPKLAQFTYDYRTEHDVPVRYVTNSLGAGPALESLRVLQRSGEEDVVDSVSMLGAGVDSDTVAKGGRYYKGVRDAAEEVHNYWIRHDGTLNEYYRAAELNDALGGTGANGPTPDNYFDHNVNHVPDHFSYFRKGHGCIDRVVDDLQ